MDQISNKTHTDLIWAKTFSHGGKKPLLSHLLDVAAVAWELQVQSPARLYRESAIFEIRPEQMLRLRVWLAALHDLGKCSVAFQAKSRDHWPQRLLGNYRAPHDPGHWRSTASLLHHRSIWPQVLKLLPMMPPQAVENLLSASAGHHGQPPSADDWRRSIEPSIGEAALAPAADIFLQVSTLLPPPSDLKLTRKQSKQISWQSSGLITLADWVGSDAEFFGTGEIGDIGVYFEKARAIAREALSAKGLYAAAVDPNAGLETVVPGLKTPRPMQVWADTVGLPDGPCLAILEDVTGSGKTEAALALAARMLAQGKGEGLYFALPTEATANAMFDRLEKVHRNLFQAGSSPSLVLAHGRAHLNEPFQKLRRAPADTAESQCSAWIADHRRKAFFAHIGAGTIDQAFLAILQKRHLTLRQYGLAGRILIVDEAHAYDAYMEEELSRLLELHAQSGGSAIVLSATLPQAKRRKLVQAYGVAQGPDLAGFPLATLTRRDRLQEQLVEAAPSSCRSVTVQRVSSTEELHATAAEAARKGAAVLVLRNAVDTAIASAEALRAAGCDTDLFHARFAHVDREKIEAKTIARFGKEGQPSERTGQILVATQVVEQSLDVDFDLILTDLAPIDLLIQRAGRLWRHERQNRPLPSPVLHVLSPEPEEDVRPDWLTSCLGTGAFVYRNPAILWRSARVLFEAGKIETPSGLRHLIEAVYGPDAPAIPAGLTRDTDTAEGRERGDRAFAGFITIDLTGGYGNLGDLSADQEIGTRLGEPVQVLRLAKLRDGDVVPWAEGVQAWARSEVRVRETWLKGTAEPPDLTAACARIRSTWPDWDRAMIAVVSEDGSVNLSGGSRLFSYDPQTGLMAEANRTPTLNPR